MRDSKQLHFSCKIPFCKKIHQFEFTALYLHRLATLLYRRLCGTCGIIKNLMVYDTETKRAMASMAEKGCV